MPNGTSSSPSSSPPHSISNSPRPIPAPMSSPEPDPLTPTISTLSISSHGPKAASSPNLPREGRMTPPSPADSMSRSHEDLTSISTNNTNDDQRKIVILKRPVSASSIPIPSSSSMGSSRELSQPNLSTWNAMAGVGTPLSEGGLRAVQEQEAFNRSHQDANHHPSPSNQVGEFATPSTCPDQTVVDALDTPKDRHLLLRADAELEKFVLDPSRTKLPLSPPYFPSNPNSYQRLLLHRLADTFGIKREVESPNPPTTNSSTGGTPLATERTSSVLMLVKTDKTALPIIRIASLLPSEDSGPLTVPSSSGNPALAGGAPPTFKIMSRSSKGGGGRMNSSSTSSVAGGPIGDGEASDAGSGSNNNNNSSKKDKKGRTLEEREAAYKEARNRIFRDMEGGLGGGGGDDSGSSSHGGSAVNAADKSNIDRPSSRSSSSDKSRASGSTQDASASVDSYSSTRKSVASCSTSPTTLRSTHSGKLSNHSSSSKLNSNGVPLGLRPSAPSFDPYGNGGVVTAPMDGNHYPSLQQQPYGPPYAVMQAQPPPPGQPYYHPQHPVHGVEYGQPRPEHQHQHQQQQAHSGHNRNDTVQMMSPRQDYHHDQHGNLVYPQYGTLPYPPPHFGHPGSPAPPPPAPSWTPQPGGNSQQSPNGRIYPGLPPPPPSNAFQNQPPPGTPQYMHMHHPQQQQQQPPPSHLHHHPPPQQHLEYHTQQQHLRQTVGHDPHHNTPYASYPGQVPPPPPPHSSWPTSHPSTPVSLPLEQAGPMSTPSQNSQKNSAYLMRFAGPPIAAASDSRGRDSAIGRQTSSTSLSSISTSRTASSNPIGPCGSGSVSGSSSGFGELLPMKQSARYQRGSSRSGSNSGSRSSIASYGSARGKEKAKALGGEEGLSLAGSEKSQSMSSAASASGASSSACSEIGTADDGSVISEVIAESSRGGEDQNSQEKKLHHSLPPKPAWVQELPKTNGGNRRAGRGKSTASSAGGSSRAQSQAGGSPGPSFRELSSNHHPLPPLSGVLPPPQAQTPLPGPPHHHHPPPAHAMISYNQPPQPPHQPVVQHPSHIAPHHHTYGSSQGMGPEPQRSWSHPGVSPGPQTIYAGYPYAQHQQWGPAAPSAASHPPPPVAPSYPYPHPPPIQQTLQYPYYSPAPAPPPVSTTPSIGGNGYADHDLDLPRPKPKSRELWDPNNKRPAARA